MLADDLLAIVDTLAVPALGFDVIEQDRRQVVLDVNVGPSFEIHVDCHPGIAQEYLRAWESAWA